MHGQHRHAGVQRCNVAVCHIHRHGAAAAGVYLTKLRNLPDHVCPLKNAPHISHGLGAGVAGTGFAPGAGVFAKADAVVQIGGVFLLVNIAKIRVIRRRYIRAEAEGIFKAHAERRPLRFAQVLHKGIEGGGLHTGYTVRANLLFVRQNAYRCLDRRFIHVQQCPQRGVAADAVIMAVSTDHGTVKADFRCLHGGNGLQLGRGEIILGDAILFVQKLHDR